MVERVDVKPGMRLEDYAGIASLVAQVQELRDEASPLVARLRGRTVWMLNSTAQGGGVAEMLPRMVTLLRELGVPCEWAVIQSDEPQFFLLTKRLHNLIHGTGDRHLKSQDRQLFERVNDANAAAMRALVRPGDVLVVHDPQPIACGATLRRTLDVTAIWRCHVGLDTETRETRAAWEFLEPYATAYDHAVFSAPEYIPDYLAGRASIIHPALDPLGHKNRELSPHKLVGVLCNAALAVDHHPVLTPPFADTARRLQPDGTFATANRPDEIGLLYRPIVTQVSRWDRLKGFAPLLRAFVKLKRERDGGAAPRARHRRRLDIVRLVLAGPDPAAVQDDPEAREVLDEMVSLFRELEPALQSEVVVLALPMASRKENALMVNALQRCSTIVVQNSLQEGFGLTAAEAMWKRVPVLVSNACGLRQQVRDGLDGRIVGDPQDATAIAATLDAMLADEVARDRWGRSAQRRVQDHFLVFTQLRRWLRLLARCAAPS